MQADGFAHKSSSLGIRTELALGRSVGAEEITTALRCRGDDFLHPLLPRRLLFPPQYPPIEHPLGRRRIRLDYFSGLRILRERLFELKRHIRIFRNAVVVRGLRLSQLVKAQSFRIHLPFFHKPRRIRKRVVAPFALFVPPREMPQERIFIQPLYRRIYPPETNCFLYKLAVRGCPLSGVPFVHDDGDFRLPHVVLAKPLSKIPRTVCSYPRHDILSVCSSILIPFIPAFPYCSLLQNTRIDSAYRMLPTEFLTVSCLVFRTFEMVAIISACPPKSQFSLFPRFALMLASASVSISSAGTSAFKRNENHGIFTFTRPASSPSASISTLCVNDIGMNPKSLPLERCSMVIFSKLSEISSIFSFSSRTPFAKFSRSCSERTCACAFTVARNSCFSFGSHPRTSTALTDTALPCNSPTPMLMSSVPPFSPSSSDAPPTDALMSSYFGLPGVPAADSPSSTFHSSSTLPFFSSDSPSMPFISRNISEASSGFVVTVPLPPELAPALDVEDSTRTVVSV